MSLIISLLITAIVIWLFFYILGQLPLDAKVKQVVQVVLAVLCLIWLLQVFLHIIPGFYYPRY